MAYQVLARKYRPLQFDQVVGQEHVTKPLVESLKNDRLAHAYIFSGPRGIGKTTTARLLAMAVNCDNRTESDGVEPCNDCESCRQIRESRDVDVVEIDGASNNSVDQVRELRENARYSPTRNHKKIYIIDEVHMLSRAAFNALLKILEEPPEHVIFVFATTEIEQLPDTILSRCQRFDFRLIPAKKIVSALKDICEEESIDVEEEALYLIAKFAEGSLRDAQSILDQMINMAGGGQRTVTEELVSDTWGIASYDRLVELLESILEKNTDSILDQLEEHLENGNDLMALISDLAEMMRNCLLTRETGNDDLLKSTLPQELIPRLQEISNQLTTTELAWMFEELIELHEKLKQNSRFQRELAEVGLVRITQGRPKYSLGEITDRLEQLQGNKERNEASPGDESMNIENKNNDSPSIDQNNEANGAEERDDTAVSPREEPAPDGDEEDRATNDEASVSSKEDASTGETNEFESRWEQVLDVISGPAKAYLLSSETVNRQGDKVEILFLDKYRNHVDRLRKDKFRREINDALEEVLGERFELDIRVIEGDHQISDEEDPEESTDDPPGENGDLVEQTKEVFEVDELEPLD